MVVREEIPSRAEIEDAIVASGGSLKPVLERFGVTYMVFRRWAKARDVDTSLIKRSNRPLSVPSDFVEWWSSAPYRTVTEALERYNLSAPLVIKRWIRETGVEYRPITGRLTSPPADELARLNEQMSTAELARHYGVSPSTIVIWFRGAGLTLKRWSSSTSQEESDFIAFLRSLDSGFVQGASHCLAGLGLRCSLDAYHSERRIAFEYDGAFWHSGVGPRVHVKKLLACERAGITLYRVHSSEWRHKREIVESIVRSKLGMTRKIGARLTVARAIGTGEASEFHGRCHLHGAGKGSVHFGLFEKERLVATMSFALSRYVQHGCQWELSRFSSLPCVTVVGGAGKLFKAFRKAYDPCSVLTFSDLRLGRGRVYEKLGFERVKRGEPTYWYYRDDCGDRFSRAAFQKKKLARKLVEFDPDASEYQNMCRNRYWRYWDCGSDHWVWHASSNK